MSYQDYAQVSLASPNLTLGELKWRVFRSDIWQDVGNALIGKALECWESFTYEQCYSVWYHTNPEYEFGSCWYDIINMDSVVSSIQKKLEKSS